MRKTKHYQNLSFVSNYGGIEGEEDLGGDFVSNLFYLCGEQSKKQQCTRSAEENNALWHRWSHSWRNIYSTEAVLLNRALLNPI